MISLDTGPTPGGRPWKRAALWLLFLAPLFYVTYGGANWLAAQRADVGSFVFGWEHNIPFLGWTIVPYWSINAFYGLSLFVCATREELDAHVRRLLTAQMIAVACFIAFPLAFTFERPELPGGFAGFLFQALGAFDKPFNQAPSLHIALTVILWPLYVRHLPRATRPALHAWFALVGVSVLTTYQHHFIDIPTGALLGLFALWLWPDKGASPIASARLTCDRKRRMLALRYAAASVALAALAILVGGWGLFLFWPAVSFLLVSASYAVLGPVGFQKAPDGRMSLAARLILAPFLLAAWINSRLWTRNDRASVEVADGVWIGRIPSRRDLAGRDFVSGDFATIIDLCAELPRLAGPDPHHAERRYHALPVLDLTAPPPETLRAAAALIERRRSAGPVLVCCALGYGRSATAVAFWLAATGRCRDADAAFAAIRAVRPRIVLDEAARAAVVAAQSDEESTAKSELHAGGSGGPP